MSLVATAVESEKREKEREGEERNLRPRSLADFIGQREVVEKLTVSIQAAFSRGEALDHLLLSGPPGLGKTSLASVISQELQSRFHSTSAPAITRPREMARLLTLLEKRDILFIDEIHRLPPACEEMLYSAMEDGFIDFIIGEGVAAQSIQLKLSPFTLVGATTRSGMLSAPLKSRFGLELKLEFYPVQELMPLIDRSARLLSMQLSAAARQELANRSRMTPRVANHLVRRVRDYMTVEKVSLADRDFVENCLTRLGIDALGLSELDRRILILLIERYGGGPVGLKTIAALVSEEDRTIEEDHEPFLLRIGLIEKTPQGRVATERAYEHLNFDLPASNLGQNGNKEQEFSF